MPQPKITFFFNQLLTEKLCTGGDIRGQIMADFFQKGKKFQVEVVTPEISANVFKNFKKIIIGHPGFENRFNHQTLVSAFILFFSRTVELIYQQSIIQTNIIYCTGDFFCNIVPAYLIKMLRPKTKFVVCIHHVNNNPFQRKSNSILANTISFIIQRFSFSLIKSKSDIIFVVNNQVKQFLLKKNFKQPIIISGNGLDIKLIKSQIESLDNIEPKNHICYFGRLSPTKGSLDFPAILAEILKHFPKTHLDLIGIALPEIKKPLVQKFKQFNCQKHYTIHNFIEDRKDIFKIMLKSKVIIFPSYEEGWGISLFESIMTKRPVITYDLPIFKEIFKNKLVTAPIGDTKILSLNAINFIKNYSKKDTQKYIRDCYLIAEKYDWKNVFLQEEKVITNLLAKK